MHGAPLADPLRKSLLTTLLLASAVMLAKFGVADPDLWGHLRFGNDILTYGLPEKATYTFTASDHVWINHAYLSEVAFALIERSTGIHGLLAVKTLLGLAIIGSMIARAGRCGASPLTTSIVVILVANVAAPGWVIRPHLFTYGLFAVVVQLLDAEAERARGDDPSATGRFWTTLWLLPPLFALWANLHGGFVAAFLVVVLYLGALGLEALWSRRAAGRRIAVYAAVVVTSGLATLLNPYGADLHRWLLEASVRARPDVTEWWPLWRYGHLYPVLALFAVTALAWGLSRRPRSLPQSLVLAVVMVQAVLHIRHVIFVALLAGYWIPPHLESVWMRFRRTRKAARSTRAPTARALRAMRATFAAASVGLAALLTIHLRGLDVDRSAYPVAALEYIARHELSGKLAVFVDWGQYVIAAFAPRISVGFDTRMDTCYPDHVVAMNYDFVLGPRPGRAVGLREEAQVLDYGEPDLVLLNRRFPHAVDIITRRPSWVLLYQDALAQLWGRRARFDDPASPAFVPPSARVIGDEAQAGYAPWPAFPTDRLSS